MKRHTSQNEKQHMGEYFSTNVAFLLSGMERHLSRLATVEPFAGAGHLADWAYKNGASFVDQYDIKPTSKEVIKNDSIKSPPLKHYQGIITNPPYLSRNKNKEKHYYEQWEQNDLYKCHLAAICKSDIKKGIAILPSNFISEANGKIRELFFKTFKLTKVKYFLYPVFDDATTGIVVIAFERDETEKESMNVPFEIWESKDKHKNVTHTLWKKYKWLAGKDFFDLIYSAKPRTFKIAREASEINSRIIIGILDHGKYNLAAHYNAGEPFLAKGKSFTTYQVILPDDALITEEQQKKAVDLYNKTLYNNRAKYDGLFLSNYMGANQKIKSRKYSNLLLSWAIDKIKEEQ